MTKSEMQRLIKIEERIKQIAREDLKFEFEEPEWDIIPSQKMLEIMSYRLPTQISNWKFGRDYERQRTIYDNYSAHAPYEIVIFSKPPRAYLMETNTFAVQVLVMAHVTGHLAVFKMNKFFANNRDDILEVLSNAQERFNIYEKKYGIEAVEKIVDAGHALQLHSTPFENETEDEIRKRIYNQEKSRRKIVKTQFSDIINSKTAYEQQQDIDLEDHELWLKLKNTSPPEPMTDLLRYIIDHSSILEDWQKDILEVLRIEGRYFWPMYKTKCLHEATATYSHMFIMEKLFAEGLLTNDEHGQYNYANSLVRAQNRFDINPYLIGSEILFDIKERWDKGRYGKEYNECTNLKLKEEWDTKEGKGWDKCLSIIRSYTDWFFMHEFLTADLVDKLDLYIYSPVDKGDFIDYVRTGHTADEVRQIIINTYAHNFIPEIEIVNGNGEYLELNHRHTGYDLDVPYAKETIKHIKNIWGKEVRLRSDKLTITTV